jgi:hypothetical protein
MVWSRSGALNFLSSRRGYSSFQEYVRVDPPEASLSIIDRTQLMMTLKVKVVTVEAAVIKIL